MRDSKITFRVSDDLLKRVDEIEESRSEIMREALRSYLEGQRHDEVRERKTPETRANASLDDVLRAMIRETVEEAVDEAVEKRLGRERDNVNVTVNVPDPHGGTEEGRQTSAEQRDETTETEADAPDVPDARRTTENESKTCHQCGEEVADEHVHCPNCGAKTAQRLFCDCGDEIRSDWSFCPSCGRRTPTSHALSKE